MTDAPVDDVHAPSRTPHVRAGALALIAIFGLCVGAVALAPAGSGVASWWPAAGAASGLLVLTSPRSWFGYVPAIAVVTALANVAGGRDVVVSLLFGAVNASEALAVAVVIGAVRTRPWLRTSEDFGRLLVAGLTGATVAGVTAAGVVALVLDGPFLTVMLDVMASHGASQVLVLPLLLLLADPESTRGRGWSRPVRVGTVVVTISVFALVHSLGQDLPIAFAPFVFLVLGAQVLTLRSQAVVSVVVGVLVTVLTAQGGGPFASAGLSPATMGALVQFDVVVIALLALPLSIAINQRAVALEQALASRETYRRGLAESIIGMVMVRPSAQGLVVLDINPPAADLLQVRADQIIGKAWTVGLGSHRAAVASAVDRMLAGEIFGWEDELWLDTQRSRCVRLALSWVPDTSSGSLIVAQLVDLTDARLARQALERERDFTEALLAATTGTAIIACDVHGAVTYANQGAARMLATTTRSLCRRRLLTDLYDSADLRRHVITTDAPSGFDALVERARSTGLPDRSDWTWRTDDGSAVRVNVHLSPLREADRTVIGYLAVAEDITARQKEHDLLRTALEREQEAVFRLEELDRTKSEFLATVSHELRTPITSIIGFTDLLTQGVTGPVNESQLQMLGRVDRGARRLMSLIENVLTASRVESSGTRRLTDPVDLTAVVVRAVGGVGHLRWGRDLDVITHLPSPEVIEVIGDSESLERVVENLVSNAVKFTPDGGLVEVAVTIDPHRSHLAVIEVSDNGIGISPEDLTRLFEPFFRSASAVKSAVQGTGLGLGIVRSVVEEHGGSVHVESSIATGTTVRVELPGLSRRDVRAAT